MSDIKKHPVKSFCIPGFPVVFFLLLVTQFLSATPAGAGQASPVSQAKNQPDEKIRRQLEQIVLSKLKFYAARFPEMNFIVLDSAADTKRNMQALAKVLGEHPTPLDYEHPKDMQDTLLSVTLERIKYLLNTDAGSSTLFRPGKDALAKRKAVCVVTMNPWSIAKDDRAATRHLLEIPASEFGRIPAKDYLDHTSHLKFVVDHEMYHCLDSFYNGPIPVSHYEKWSGYNIRKNELGADAFASLMNTSAHGHVTQYIYTLHNIRALTLLSGDFDHYTYDIHTALQNLDVSNLDTGDVKKCFRIATIIRNKINGSYKDYIHYHRLAETVNRILTGHNESTHLNVNEADYKQIKTMLDDLNGAYKELFGHSLFYIK